MTERIREEVSTIILREMKDPRLGFITVTRVTVTQDLKAARVYVSVLGDKGVVSRTMHALHNAEGFLTTQIARRLNIRTTPRIAVEFDPTIERSIRISNLIDEAVKDTRPVAKADDEE